MPFCSLGTDGEDGAEEADATEAEQGPDPAAVADASRLVGALLQDSLVLLELQVRAGVYVCMCVRVPSMLSWRIMPCAHPRPRPSVLCQVPSGWGYGGL